MTSGDAARVAMFRGAVGRRVWFIGQEADLLLRAADDRREPVAIERVPLDEAEGIVCCGLFDPHADPEANRPEFERATRGACKLLCANPDIVVDLGDERVWCAGALAQLYERWGAPRSTSASRTRRSTTSPADRLAATGPRPRRPILCIGDGP